jgi:hypothetical protein
MTPRMPHARRASPAPWKPLSALSGPLSIEFRQTLNQSLDLIAVRAVDWRV